MEVLIAKSCEPFCIPSHHVLNLRSFEHRFANLDGIHTKTISYQFHPISDVFRSDFRWEQNRPIELWVQTSPPTWDGTQGGVEGNEIGFQVLLLTTISIVTSKQENTVMVHKFHPTQENLRSTWSNAGCLKKNCGSWTNFSNQFLMLPSPASETVTRRPLTWVQVVFLAFFRSHFRKKNETTISTISEKQLKN